MELTYTSKCSSKVKKGQKISIFAFIHIPTTKNPLRGYSLFSIQRRLRFTFKDYVTLSSSVYARNMSMEKIPF